MSLKSRFRDRLHRRIERTVERFDTLDTKLLYTEPHTEEWDDVERERTRALRRLAELERKASRVRP